MQKTLKFICINYPYTTSHVKSVLGTKLNTYLVIYTSNASTVSLHEVSITVALFQPKLKYANKFL